jgi:hypothetical protein
VRGVLALLLLALLIWIGVASARRLLPCRAHRVVATAVGIILVLTTAFGIGAVRRRSRYAVYVAAAAGRAFDVHPIKYATSWPVWQGLDDGSPRRVAVVAGWDGSGHNWYRYPLFGSRLQNEVVYVAPTADGAVLDYGLDPTPEPRMRFDAWLGRLRQRGIDTVVTLAPPTLEAGWMQGHPESFARLVCSADQLNCAYHFRPAASER